MTNRAVKAPLSVSTVTPASSCRIRRAGASSTTRSPSSSARRAGDLLHAALELLLQHAAFDAHQAGEALAAAQRVEEPEVGDLRRVGRPGALRGPAGRRRAPRRCAGCARSRSPASGRPTRAAFGAVHGASAGTVVISRSQRFCSMASSRSASSDIFGVSPVKRAEACRAAASRSGRRRTGRRSRSRAAALPPAARSGAGPPTGRRSRRRGRRSRRAWCARRRGPSASSTITERPRATSSLAAFSPAMPAPTTMTSTGSPTGTVIAPPPPGSRSASRASAEPSRAPRSGR